LRGGATDIGLAAAAALAQEFAPIETFRREVLHMLFHRRLVLSSMLAAGLAAGISFAPATAQAQDVIKIGTPLALSGGLAEEGKKQKIAYDMWLRRVNAAGGINVGGKKMKVKLIAYDYQTEGKRAGQLTEKLITDDKVHFLAAPFGSGHTKITAGVAARYGVPIVAPTASSLSVYNQGFKVLFGTLAPNTGMTEAMMKFFKQKNPGMKNIAVLGRDDVFPRAMAKTLSKGAKARGFNVVYDQLYAVGTLDHSAALTKIKGLKPDWIYLTGYTQDLILLRKQMNDLGVKAKIVTMVTGPAYKEFVDGLGKLADGVTSSSWWHHATNYKTNDVFGSTKAFYDQFVKEQKHDPDYVHASSAAAMIVLQKAIEKAGTLDRAKVRDALASLDITTFYGPIKFSPNGMNQVRDLPIIQVQKGKVGVLFPNDIKNADFQNMPD
jgi:branched-chain amino acid transport system substrate-binding protein